jgi:hypothetical protein
MPSDDISDTLSFGRELVYLDAREKRGYFGYYQIAARP